MPPIAPAPVVAGTGAPPLSEQGAHLLALRALLGLDPGGEILHLRRGRLVVGQLRHRESPGVVEDHVLEEHDVGLIVRRLAGGRCTARDPRRWRGYGSGFAPTAGEEPPSDGRRGEHADHLVDTHR